MYVSVMFLMVKMASRVPLFCLKAEQFLTYFCSNFALNPSQQNRHYQFGHMTQKTDGAEVRAFCGSLVF